MPPSHTASTDAAGGNGHGAGRQWDGMSGSMAEPDEGEVSRAAQPGLPDYDEYVAFAKALSIRTRTEAPKYISTFILSLYE